MVSSGGTDARGSGNGEYAADPKVSGQQTGVTIAKGGLRGAPESTAQALALFGLCPDRGSLFQKGIDCVGARLPRPYQKQTAGIEERPQQTQSGDRRESATF